MHMQVSGNGMHGALCDYYTGRGARENRHGYGAEFSLDRQLCRSTLVHQSGLCAPFDRQCTNPAVCDELARELGVVRLRSTNWRRVYIISQWPRCAAVTYCMLVVLHLSPAASRPFLNPRRHPAERACSTISSKARARVRTGRRIDPANLDTEVLDFI